MPRALIGVETEKRMVSGKLVNTTKPKNFRPSVSNNIFLSGTDRYSDELGIKMTASGFVRAGIDLLGSLLLDLFRVFDEEVIDLLISDLRIIESGKELIEILEAVKRKRTEEMLNQIDLGFSENADPKMVSDYSRIMDETQKVLKEWNLKDEEVLKEPFEDKKTESKSDSRIKDLIEISRQYSDIMVSEMRKDNENPEIALEVREEVEESISDSQIDEEVEVKIPSSNDLLIKIHMLPSRKAEIIAVVTSEDKEIIRNGITNSYLDTMSQLDARKLRYIFDIKRGKTNEETTENIREYFGLEKSFTQQLKELKETVEEIKSLSDSTTELINENCGNKCENADSPILSVSFAYPGLEVENADLCLDCVIQTLITNPDTSEIGLNSVKRDHLREICKRLEIKSSGSMSVLKRRILKYMGL